MLYTLEGKLLAALVALLVLLATVGTSMWYGYRSGSAHVQRKWDADNAKKKDLADKELKADRDVGYQAAVELQHQLSALEAKYAELDGKYRKSLHTRVVCPASGEVGDVVLPADLVDSMFVTAKSPRDAASGSAGSGTDKAVR